jgi:hypothetical protein
MTSQTIRIPVRIIGIDPGLRRTGWGVIESEGNRLIFVGCGSVEPSGDLPLARRLLAIHEGLAAVLGQFKPMEAAVEQTFVNKDGVATLKLGQARYRGCGVCPEPGQEDRGRGGTCRQEPDRGDAEDPAPQGRAAFS